MFAAKQARQSRSGPIAVAPRAPLLSLQRKVASDGVRETVPSIVHDVLSSPGQPLDRKVLAVTEPRFGHDFSRVRVHTDPKATESAAALGAQAYTVGRHIIFAQGEYDPGSRPGLSLLSHELVHVVQQRAVSDSSPRVEEVSRPEDPAELEASRIGASFGASELPTDGSLQDRIQVVSPVSSIGLLQRQATHPDPDCEDLLVQIIARLVELKERADALINNLLNLPPTGPMSVDGHQQQFRNKQVNLRRMLQQWDTNNCGPGYIPADAWQWATRPAPSPAPSGSSQRSMEPVRDGTSITPEEVATAAGAAAVTVGAGYLIYRAVRFLPSLLPPLWWTIPANAAIP